MQKAFLFREVVLMLLVWFGAGAGQPARAATAPAPTVHISANPQTMQSGQQSWIIWSTSNATSCEASGHWSGSKHLHDSHHTLQLTTSETYTLTCTGPGGRTTKSAAVDVIRKPSLSLFASPSRIASGNSTVITWSTTNATTCVASGHWSGNKHLHDSHHTLKLTTSETYTLTCDGPGGHTTKSARVEVVHKPSPTAPSVTLRASPSIVASGGSTTITWSSSNATACTSSGAWTGPQALDGSKSTGALRSDAVYALRCTGPGGAASHTATVAVTSAPAAGNAILSWSPPTTNTNGTPVTGLRGYHLYYGKSTTALTQSIAVGGATTTNFEISGLTAGTWYFAVAADAADGTESARSAVQSKTI